MDAIMTAYKEDITQDIFSTEIHLFVGKDNRKLVQKIPFEDCKQIAKDLANSDGISGCIVKNVEVKVITWSAIVSISLKRSYDNMLNRLKSISGVNVYMDGPYVKYNYTQPSMMMLLLEERKVTWESGECHTWLFRQQTS